MFPSTKKCPFCAESINVEAIKCKYCGEFIDRGLSRSVVQGPPVIVQSPPYRKWSPGIAALLSFIIPGAGQIYKGKVLTGILWFILVGIGYFLLIVPGVILHLVCIITAAAGNPYED